MLKQKVNTLFWTNSCHWGRGKYPTANLVSILQIWIKIEGGIGHWMAMKVMSSWGHCWRSIASGQEEPLEKCSNRLTGTPQHSLTPHRVPDSSKDSRHTWVGGHGTWLSTSLLPSAEPRQSQNQCNYYHFYLFSSWPLCLPLQDKDLSNKLLSTLHYLYQRRETAVFLAGIS